MPADEPNRRLRNRDDRTTRSANVSEYDRSTHSPDRAVSPVVGVVLLLAVTLMLAAAVGASLSTPELETTPTASFDLTVESETKAITLSHRGGDTLNVTDLHLEIYIDGDPLTHQPPLPFFASDGFDSGPTGPFNSKHATDWQAGERASVRLAGTNAPLLQTGSEVEVTLTTDETMLYQETVVAD